MGDGPKTDYDWLSEIAEAIDSYKLAAAYGADAEMDLQNVKVWRIMEAAISERKRRVDG